MVVKQKKHKFAVRVDEFGRKKSSLSDFLDVLKEEYSFLTQANRIVAQKRAANAKQGDLIIFGFSRKYDYRVVSEEEWEEISIHRNTPEVDLDADWEEVMDLLEHYASSNYPDEFEDDDDYYRYCRKHDDTVYYFDDCCWDDILIVTDTPKKRRSAPKRKTVQVSSKLGLEKMDVFHNFVKVGWNVYDIKFNEDDEEYVKINGNIYWIDRDSNGYGKISVQ